jgi:hypothetical protein
LTFVQIGCVLASARGASEIERFGAANGLQLRSKAH